MIFFRMPVALAACIAALLVAAPTPAASMRLLRGAATPDAEAVVAAVGLLAWLLAGYLVLVTTLTVASRVGGVTGRLTGFVLRRLAPVAVRHAVAGALGVGLVLGTGGVAHAEGGAPPASGEASPAHTSLDWLPPAQPAGPAQPVVPDRPAAPDQPVTVRAGDSLWSIAASRLPTGASNQAVARAWPTWWTANRAVIGDDPGRLHPGQQLTPPTSPEETP